jgi:hypothetical protein
VNSHATGRISTEMDGLPIAAAKNGAFPLPEKGSITTSSGHVNSVRAVVTNGAGNIA